jgi:hypothetical protein
MFSTLVTLLNLFHWRLIEVCKLSWCFKDTSFMLAVQMSLAPLTGLRKLILLGNQQSELEIPEGSFQELEVLRITSV